MASVYAGPLFHHKKVALPGSPNLAVAPETRTIEKTVEVIREVPVYRTVQVDRPVEVIRHVPVYRTVVQRVNVPYAVNYERRNSYPIREDRNIQNYAAYPAPNPEPVPLEQHELSGKLDHIKNYLEDHHSIVKRSPILHKIKNKIHSKIHAKKGFFKGGFKKIFG